MHYKNYNGDRKEITDEKVGISISTYSSWEKLRRRCEHWARYWKMIRSLPDGEQLEREYSRVRNIKSFAVMGKFTKYWEIWNFCLGREPRSIFKKIAKGMDYFTWND